MKGRPGSVAPHGTNARYVGGCGCDECRAAHVRYNKRAALHRMSGRPGLVDSTGTTRRLRALACMQWSAPDVAARLGVTPPTVQQLRSRPAPTVERATAEKVAAVYDELSMTIGPSARVRGYAIRAGWATPLAWDDDTIDDPAATPCAEPYQPGHLDLDEWVRLVTWGESPENAAARYGVTLGAVTRAAERAHRDDVARLAERAERRTA